MLRIIRSGFCLLSMAILSATGFGLVFAQETETPVTVIDFARDIKPVFENHCISCHGPEKEENFRIDDKDALLAYVEAGDAEFSQLYEALTSEDEEVLMPPPEENKPLSPVQIGLVKTWIESGANWPEEVKLVAPAKPADPPQSTDETASNGQAAVPQADPQAVQTEKQMGERIWLALGPLHPAAVHLPIGLLLGAGLFALMGLRGNFVMSDCAYYCLWLGAITSIFAAVFGWSYAIHEHHDADFRNLFDTTEKVFLHRISGIGASLFALLLALYASAARAADPDDGLLWKLGAIVLAIAIGFVGHSGGELTYGKNHYRELYNIVDEITGWNTPAVQKNDGGESGVLENQPPANGEKTGDLTGQTSTESESTKGTGSTSSGDKEGND